MPVIKDNNNPDDVFGYQLYLISYIASNKNLLKRADATSLKNIKPHELYEWDEVGTLVSGKEGIVEPIVQSINKFFANYPKQIERLFDIAGRSCELRQLLHGKVPELIEVDDSEIDDLYSARDSVSERLERVRHLVVLGIVVFGS